MMILEPGNDMGNVVAWRDFKQPSSIPDEKFKVEDKGENFRFSQSKVPFLEKRQPHAREGEDFFSVRLQILGIHF